MRHWVLKMVYILLLIGFWGALVPQAFAQSKKDVVKELSSLRAQNKARLAEISTRMGQVLQNTQSLRLTDTQRSRTGAELQILEKEVESLRTQQSEHLLRQDFWDRLIFQVDHYYKGKKLKGFLKVKLQSMALVEAQNPRSHGGLWKFMSYLSVAVKNLPERNENLISFIEGYMNFSSVSKPIRPDQYVSLRDYTNGRENVTAQTISQDTVGESLDHQLAEMKQSAAEAQEAVRFELRRPILKGIEKQEPVFGPPVEDQKKQ